MKISKKFEGGNSRYRRRHPMRSRWRVVVASNRTTNCDRSQTIITLIIPCDNLFSIMNMNYKRKNNRKKCEKTCYHSVMIVCDRSQLIVRSEATTTLHRDHIGCRRRYREFPPSNFFEIFVTYQSLLEHHY